MRLNKYLIEANDKISAKDLFTDIKKKCKPYLSLLKGKEPLYRGIHDTSDAKTTLALYDKFGNPIEKPNNSDIGAGIGYGIKKTHKDRKPKGSGDVDFKLLNKWLAGNGHARRDQSISVTADKVTADFFGSNSWVFPIGNFNYSWVKSPDMNHKNAKEGYYVGHFYPDEPSIWDFLRAYYGSGIMDSQTKKGDLANFITTNKGFNEARKKGYEIWFDCKEYYYILVMSNEGYNYKWKELSNII